MYLARTHTEDAHTQDMKGVIKCLTQILQFSIYNTYMRIDMLVRMGPFSLAAVRPAHGNTN